MSRALRKTVTIECIPSAEDLAKVFWSMGAGEQAVFFNTLGEISGGALIVQLQYVNGNPELDDEGRHAMEMIGNYSELEAYK